MNKVLPKKQCSALLMPDYCTLTMNQGTLNEMGLRLIGPEISIEIKPKKGFLLSVDPLHTVSSPAIKVCKFALKQQLKAS